MADRLRFPTEQFTTGMQIGSQSNALGNAIRSTLQRYQTLRTQREQQAGEMDLFRRKSEVEFEGFKKQEKYKTGLKATETESMRQFELGKIETKQQFELKKQEREQAFKRTEASAGRIGGLRELKYEQKIKGFSDEDFKIWKQAENEVVTKLGGSAMMPLRSKSEEYYRLIEERFYQLKAQFRGGRSQIVRPSVNDGTITDTNW